MSTPKLAHRMWWVGTLGWALLVAAGAFWASMEIVLIDGGRPAVVVLTLLLSGSFLVGLASAWFGWFAVLTDRVLSASDRRGSTWVRAVAVACLLLSPATLVLVLKSVKVEPSPTAFGLSWSLILVSLAVCFWWLRRWIADYAHRAA